MAHVVTLSLVVGSPRTPVRAEARPIQKAAATVGGAIAKRLRGVAAVSIKAAIGLSAGAYLFAHTVAESKWWRRFRPRPGASQLEIVPSEKLDVVDQASWESFPASDPPGF